MRKVTKERDLYLQAPKLHAHALMPIRKAVVSAPPEYLILRTTIRGERPGRRIANAPLERSGRVRL